MGSLQRFRQAARAFIALCLLAYGLALAMPTLAPQAVQMVCSGQSMKLVTGDAEGDSGQRMDCPLCAAGLPSPAAQSQAPKPDSTAYALTPIALANLASLTAPPLPARGPPQL